MATACNMNGREQNTKYLIPLDANGQEIARTPAEEIDRSTITSFGVGTHPNGTNL